MVPSSPRGQGQCGVRGLRAETESPCASPSVQALLDTHDTIAERRHAGEATTNGINGCHSNATFMPEENGYPVDTIRMVGLRKKPDEPLGLTVREDEPGCLIIARIMAGGSIDRQGLLHVGDAICEVNGVEVSLAVS